MIAIVAALLVLGVLAHICLTAVGRNAWVELSRVGAVRAAWLVGGAAICVPAILVVIIVLTR